MKRGDMVVPICHDHFMRVARKDTCDRCPSRMENEAAVRMIAQQYAEDTEAGREALITEIQSIRRLQGEAVRAIENIPQLKEEILKFKIMLVGVDGSNGLRSELRACKAEMAELRATVETIKQRVWLAMGGLSLVAFALPVVFRL